MLHCELKRLAPNNPPDSLIFLNFSLMEKGLDTGPTMGSQLWIVSMDDGMLHLERQGSRLVSVGGRIIEPRTDTDLESRSHAELSYIDGRD